MKGERITELIRQRFSKKPAFSIAEIRKYVKGSYAYVLLNMLLRRGEVHRITKGFYTFMDDVLVVGEAYFPYYYGLYEALSLRNLFEQETNPVVITPRKVRSGMRSFLGRNYLIKRIDRRMFFGYELIKYYDFYVYVSDYEKTLIDFVYYREHLPEDAKEELIGRINTKKLKEYLNACSPGVRKRVLALF